MTKEERQQRTLVIIAWIVLMAVALAILIGGGEVIFVFPLLFVASLLGLIYGRNQRRKEAPKG